jgi:DNA polymerase III epsilon subunit-like protein
MNTIIFDTETTGIPTRSWNFEGQPRIIEIAALKVDPRGNIIDRLESFINPETKIPAKITKITGIKCEDVENAPTFRIFLPKLIDFFGDSNEVGRIIAHNLSFDLKMMKLELDRCVRFQSDHTWMHDKHGEIFRIPGYGQKGVCSQLEFAHLFGDKYPSLKELFLYAFPDQEGNSDMSWHRAMDDVRVLMRILDHFDYFLPHEKNTSGHSLRCRIPLKCFCASCS